MLIIFKLMLQQKKKEIMWTVCARRVNNSTFYICCTFISLYWHPWIINSRKCFLSKSSPPNAFIFQLLFGNLFKILNRHKTELGENSQAPQKFLNIHYVQYLTTDNYFTKWKSATTVISRFRNSFLLFFFFFIHWKYNLFLSLGWETVGKIYTFFHIFRIHLSNCFLRV